MEKMILSNDECVHPVPPPDCNTSDENNNSMDFELPSVHSCYACDFVGSLIRELNDHQRKRTIKAAEAEPGLGRIIYPLT